ncbi:hypothetical protein ABK040_001456 [Willaertia magna]
MDYSRQQQLIDSNDQTLIGQSKVLFIGGQGTSVEAIKNLLLVGVNNIDIYDNDFVNPLDIGCSYFPLELGKIRSDELVKHLGFHNRQASLTSLKCAEEELLNKIEQKSYNVVVKTDNVTLNEFSFKVDEVCHKNDIKLIICCVSGLNILFFEDFGKEFNYQVFHNNYQECFKVFSIGEENQNEDSDSATKGDTNNILDKNNKRYLVKTEVTVNKDDLIRFLDTEEKSKEIEVEVVDSKLNEFSFISNTKIVNSGSVYFRRKSPLVKGNHLPLTRFLNDISLTQTRDAKQNHLMICLFSLLSILDKKQQHNHTQTMGKEETLLFLEKVKEYSSKFRFVNQEELQKVAIEFSRVCYTTLQPICAVAGSALGMEILKAITGKYIPLVRSQFKIISFDINFPKTGNISTLEFKEESSRFLSQEQLLGSDIQRKLEDLTILLVGSGAIGCEVLKNLGAMGVCSGKGKLFLCDDDYVSISNLHRQLLFTEDQALRMQNKAEAAAETMNNLSSKTKIIPMNKKIIEFSENDSFYNQLNVIISAVDSFNGREYFSLKSHVHNIPMIEGGTDGTNGSASIVYPFKTNGYFSPKGFVEESSVCPGGMDLHKPSNVFKFIPEMFRQRFNYNSLKDIIKEAGSENLEEVAQDFPIIEEHIKQLFKEVFVDMVLRHRSICESKLNDIVKLAKEEDSIEAEYLGRYIKKPPIPQEFEEHNENHKQFGLVIRKLLIRYANKGIKEPHFFVDFDKDDEDHVEFAWIVYNMLAKSYHHPPLEKSLVRSKVGNIMPAFIMSTALVSGIMALNVLKVVLEKEGISQNLVNSNCRLGELQMTSARSSPSNRYLRLNNREATIKDVINCVEVNFEGANVFNITPFFGTEVVLFNMFKADDDIYNAKVIDLLLESDNRIVKNFLSQLGNKEIYLKIEFEQEEEEKECYCLL